MVTAATTCVAVWLSQYCGAKHSFTMATVGVVTVAAYGICCAFLTMHDQASYLSCCLSCTESHWQLTSHSCTKRHPWYIITILSVGTAPWWVLMHHHSVNVMVFILCCSMVPHKDAKIWCAMHVSGHAAQVSVQFGVAVSSEFRGSFQTLNPCSN